MSTFVINDIYVGSIYFYKVIKRSATFITLASCDDEFETNGIKKRNSLKKPIRRKIRNCCDNSSKLNIFQLDYKGEFVNLGLSSITENLFACNKFSKVCIEEEETYPCGCCDKEMTLDETNTVDEYGWVCDACVEDLSSDAEEEV
tara:strand:+ start:752 stop:1186 length:435 start_codon:yes stop_codon:yes gene_type:complete